MKVDLYTDAGVRNGLATWATVIVKDGVVVRESCGRMRADLKCSSTAEIRAIANALHRMLRAGEISPGDEVHIYSDNQHAVYRITGGWKHKPESAPAKAAAVALSLAEAHGLTLKGHWIKGHRPDGSSKHAKHNNRCDALCREARALPKPSKARKALAIAKRLAGVTN